MATKSTPDGVDLKLSNYSTTAAMNGSIASANNATLATVAANYGLKTAVDQHPGHSGEDHAAGGGHQGGQRSPGGRHRRGAGLQAREQRRLHLGAAGLQGHGGPGLDTPLDVDTKIANALLGLATEAFVAAQLASRDASITALQGAKADATLLASYATNAALSASKSAPEHPRRNPRGACRPAAFRQRSC